MTASIKSLTKQTLIYGVGTILARFVTFLLLPVYTNILPAAEYGLAALIFAFLGFMIIIFNYGLDSAVIRYYSATKDPQQQQSILSTSVYLCLLTSAGLAAVIYLNSASLANLLLHETARAVLIKYAALILFFDALAHVPFALLRLEEKPWPFMGLKLLNVGVVFGLNIYLVAGLKRGVEGIFESNLFTSALTTLILMILIIPRLRITFSGSAAKDLLQFGLPFIPAGLASVCMEMLNRYIIERLLDLRAVGIFSAGFKLGIFMLLLTSAFYYAWQPFFLKAGPRESSRPLFARVLTYFLLIELAMWLVLTAFMPEIVRFHIGSVYLIGPEYQGCGPMVPLILMGYVFLGMNQVFLPGIYFEKKTRYLAYMTFIAAAVNVGFNYLLVPRLGIIGSAYGSLIGYFVLALQGFFVSQKLFYVPYDWRRVGLLLGLTLVIGVPVYMIPLAWYWRLGLVLVWPVLLAAGGFFRKDEIAILKELLRLPVRA